jgi:hypothetical protein
MVHPEPHIGLVATIVAFEGEGGRSLKIATDHIARQTTFDNSVGSVTVKGRPGVWLERTLKFHMGSRRMVGLAWTDAAGRYTIITSTGCSRDELIRVAQSIT